jgi:hypothetical protein
MASTLNEIFAAMEPPAEGRKQLASRAVRLPGVHRTAMEPPAEGRKQPRWNPCGSAPRSDRNGAARGGAETGLGRHTRRGLRRYSRLRAVCQRDCCGGSEGAAIERNTSFDLGASGPRAWVSDRRARMRRSADSSAAPVAGTHERGTLRQVERTLWLIMNVEGLSVHGHRPGANSPRPKWLRWPRAIGPVTGVGNCSRSRAEGLAARPC